MIGFILALIGLSNASEKSEVQRYMDFKSMAIESAMNGDTKHIDCFDKWQSKGITITLQKCEVK